MAKLFLLHLWILGVCLAFLLDCSRADNEDEECALSTSPYSIVIDGGSTGSRLHVFYFHASSVERKGSFRANVPLSAFGPEEDEMLEPQVVAAHILDLFVQAAEVVPACHYNTTLARYEATAGMRLLTLDQQGQVYDALYEGLMASPDFVFRGMARSDVETLSGDLEGYYGAVAANYLSGIIDTDMTLLSHKEETHMRQDPIGALDMGGSSTQIVYLTKEEQQVDNGSHNCDANLPPAQEDYPETCRNPQAPASPPQPPQQLQGDHFFSTSYLSYGVDEFRERLWNTLISERYQQTPDETCDTKVIPYPCGFEGHQIDYLDYTLVGTGNATHCQEQIQRLLPHADQATDTPTKHAGQQVGGIAHPTVPRGQKFFAMSLYFFTLDSLRVLSHPHAQAHQALNKAWPRPSLAELAHALEGLCGRSWTHDLVHIQHDAHQFTRPAVLPHRCFESVYMVTLLRDGFGLDVDARDITFAFLVQGSEVEWSLGMALALRQQQQQDKQDDNDNNKLKEREGVESSTATCDESDDDNNNQTQATAKNKDDNTETIPEQTRIPFASVAAGSG